MHNVKASFDCLNVSIFVIFMGYILIVLIIFFFFIPK